VHALSCDRCKTGVSCSTEALVLAPGLRLLGRDPDAHVRAMAIELVGRFAHGNAESEAALVRAREADPSPAVRKKAGLVRTGRHHLPPNPEPGAVTHRTGSRSQTLIEATSTVPW
jgi:hypothetical protein